MPKGIGYGPSAMKKKVATKKKRPIAKPKPKTKRKGK